MPADKPPTLFDAYYYAHGCGAPYERTPELLNFFQGIAEHIHKEIQPATVLDAGCAMGFLVESLRRRGVAAWGLDISEYAIQKVHADVKPYCWVGSVSEPFPARYDLIVSIEVLEHMPRDSAEKAVVNLCQHSNDILFSSTPFDYKEATHLNVQPPEYWGELFGQQGFYRDVDYDAAFITPWAVRYRRRDEPLPRLVRDYERKFWLLRKENTDLRSLTLEMREQLARQDSQLKALEEQVKRQEYLIRNFSPESGATEKSAGWKLVRAFWRIRLRLAPHGSRRERILQRLKRWLKLDS